MTKDKGGRRSSSYEDPCYAPQQPSTSQFGIQYIEELIPKFSGKDKTYSVSRWIQDVEDNGEILHWTPLQQLIFARRALVGTAALWLKSERPFKNWDELKQALAKEFPDAVDQKSLHEMMSNRKKRNDEGCLDYLLVMKEMGRRGKMADYVAIKYIIDGIQDEETNKIMLYGVTTYPDLKEKLKIYETVKEKMKKSPRPVASTEPVKKNMIRCYNCGEKSHHSRDCPHKHLGLKCFKCNNFGHIAPNCKFEVAEDLHRSHQSEPSTSRGSCAATSRQSFRHVGGAAPAATGGRRYSRQYHGGGSESKRTMFTQHCSCDIGKCNMSAIDVPDDIDRRVTFETGKKVMLNNQDVNKDVMCNFLKKNPEKLVKISNTNTNALIDTGSEVNLMSEDFYTKIGSPKCDAECLALSGFGRSKVYSMGKTIVSMTIDGQTYSDVIFHVICTDFMPYDLIIGQEFLSYVTLVMNEGNITFMPSREDWFRNISLLSDVSYILGCEISKEVQDQVKQLVDCYHPIKTQEAPIQLRIVLKDDVPVAQRPRRLAIKEREEVERQVEQWLKDGIIRVSWSEYASPIVLARKKDGSIRICVDYREINKKIVKDEYPMPVIDDHIDGIGDAKVFSTIDLKNAYFHLSVHEDSIKYTSFVTHHGQYEFLKAPFGLAICPKVFTRYISIIFHNLIVRKIVLIFIDDLLILAQNERQALDRLQEVLQISSQYGLEINWEKSQFVVKKVEYLGHVIENGQIKPSTDKTDAVRRFPEPKTIKQLQSFVGLTSYFRKFIQNYSLIAKPLTDLLRKDCSFEFNQEHKEAFQILKEKLASTPILRIFDSRLDTELHTDASSIAYAAILMQKSNDDGYLHPIYYMSRKTTEVESRYSSYELEALAIVEGIKKFRKYLFGKRFKLVTDCKAFQMTLEKKDITSSPRVARWVMMLQEYDFTVEHRSGSKMRHVDALSRNPYVATITSDFIEKLKLAQANDVTLKAIIEIVKEKPYEDYWLENGLLFKGSERHLVVPRNMEMELIRKAHENGHFGKKKTVELLNKDYYIKSLDKKVAEYIQTCIPCLLASRKAGKQEGFLSPIEKGELPLDTLHLDHIGPLTETKKQYNYILTVVDAFTKFTWIFPTKSTTSKEVIEKMKIHQQTFGNPRRIITDKGTSFTSNDFATYCKEEKVEHITITTGIPRGNGQVERIHRIIIAILTKICIQEPANWYRHVSRLQQSLNSTYQRSINVTPFELLTGTKMRLKQDLTILNFIEEENKKMFMDNRDELRLNAKEQIMKIQDENRRNYNKKRKDSTKYQLGELVAIKRTQFGVGMKLKPKFLGPYRITKVKRSDRYEVEKINPSDEGPKKTSSAADHMKRWPSGCEDTGTFAGDSNSSSDCD